MSLPLGREVIRSLLDSQVGIWKDLDVFRHKLLPRGRRGNSHVRVLSVLWLNLVQARCSSDPELWAPSKGSVVVTDLSCCPCGGVWDLHPDPPLLDLGIPVRSCNVDVYFHSASLLGSSWKQPREPSLPAMLMYSGITPRTRATWLSESE